MALEDIFLQDHNEILLKVKVDMIASIWNLQALLHIEEMVKRGKLSVDLLDLPNYVGNETN